MSARFVPARLPRLVPAARVGAVALLVATAAGLTALKASQPAPARRAVLRAGQAAPAASGLAPEDLGLDKDALRRTAAAAKSFSGPPHPMECGDLEMVLDGFGGFGSASAGGDAFFDGGSGARATVFEAMAHLRGAGFLDADSLALPQTDAHSGVDGDAVVASYVRGPFRFDLRSRLVDCADPHAAALAQQWTITNVSTRAQNLGFTVYVDGDMFFAGDHRDDFGVRTDDAMWQFDQPGTDVPSPYLKLTSEAPLAPSVLRQISEYSDQRRRINRNETLRDGLWRSTGAAADADGDGVTDSGFDVSMAIGHEFGLVAPGQVVTVDTRLEWGVGSVDDVVPQPFAVSLGPDRAQECEGHDGTLVAVQASVEPAGAATRFAWTVDGAPADGDELLQSLLAPGEHEIAVTATDDAGRSASDEVIVTVQDTVPPEATVSEVLLWPPDHRLVPVDLPVDLRDGCGGAQLRVLAVESSEPDEVGRGGDGMFTGDAVVIGGRAWLRRERQGGGEDRVYTVRCEAVDGAGNSVPVTVIARVPHDRSGR